MKYKPEIVFAYFKSEKIPTPVTEHQFALSIGRKWRFDFAWPDHKLALEVEGGIWTRGAHGRGTGIKRDIEKYNTAALLGWMVLRVTPENLCMLETVRMIKQMLTRKDGGE